LKILKTITFKQKGKSIFHSLSLFLFFLSFYTSFAQVQNDGVVYIGNQGSFFVESGSFNFGTTTGSTTTTRRSDVLDPLDTNYGKLIFASGTSTTGVSDAHFLDGYGSYLGTSPFLFPTGQTGVYAPVRVTPSSNSGVDAAYYRSSAVSIAATLDPSVSAISSVEYWDITGSNTSQISLTWRSSSNILSLVSNLNSLTIVGYDGIKWVEIPSSYDTTSILGGSSTTTAGSISTTALVNLSLFKAFSLGSKGSSCPPLVASSGNTKTWDGSWSPSAPTIADPVIISTPYSAGSFACNSLVLNANATLSDGQSIEIVNGVTGTGRIIMSSEASVVQRASGVSAPNIELTKRTRNVMRRFDYVYWGTPIAGNFFSQLAGAQASTATLANAFDYKYKYVSGAGGGWQALFAIETGKGYIMRIKSQAPFTTATATDYINMKFSGVANNGDITVPVTNNPSALNGGTSHVLLANPYPSAIDADKFLTDNTNIDGVVYIWTAASANAGTSQTYTQADYIAYTRAGAVIPTNIPTTFNGKIASGQGFKVKSLTNSGNVTFTNCMRLTADNDQFYRTNNYVQTNQPRDRYKLNMTGSNGVYSQILVAYLPEATLGYDRMYDAGRNSVSTAQLYSIFEGDGRRLAINARPTFTDTDVVPLGISKSDTTNESFTIGIAEKEGIFNSNAVTVYLHDLVQNTYYNLSNGDYTFSTSASTLNNRFEVVYQNGLLSNPDFNNVVVSAYINNQNFMVNANQIITSVEIFDITGRKILSEVVNGKNQFTTPFLFPQAVYIAKIKLDNGTVATVKLMNEK
jgi:hypothetical protein